MYLNYDNYQPRDKEIIKEMLSKIIFIVFYVLLISSIDLVVNYNIKYADKIRISTDSISYRLVDYGYSISNDNKQILNYKKDDSSIIINLDKMGTIKDIKTNIYIYDFLDLATIKYVLADLIHCDEKKVGEFSISIDSCIDNKCNNDIEFKCNQYLFTFKKNNDKYVIIN